jgi:hypothetical protein
MVTALAWAYVRFGSLPQLAGILYGIKTVVIAVVAQALWNLVPKAIKKSSGSARLALPYARGLDMLIGVYNYLDLTPLGRHEADAEHPLAWVKLHDEYA